MGRLANTSETLDALISSDYDNQKKIERVFFNDKLRRNHFIVAGKFGASTLGARSFGIFRNRIYSGIYSSYSAPGSRIGGMEIQVFGNKNSSQTNASSHYSTYSYSGLIQNERALGYTKAMHGGSTHHRAKSNSN